MMMLKARHSMFFMNARRCFSETEAKTKSSLYIWKAIPRFSTKASQTGDKFSIPSGKPMLIESVKDAVSVHMGTRASGIIDGDGNLYTFGSGNWGVLGHGNENNVAFKKPKLVERLVSKNVKVRDVAFGRYHAAAVGDDGSLWTWGYGGATGFLNFFNQEVGALGHGDVKSHFQPKKVAFFEENNLKVVKAVAGINHTAVICDDDNVYTWGQGLYGVLGHGTNKPSLVPKMCEEFSILRTEAAEEGASLNIRKLSAADEYTGVLTSEGLLYTWGKNDRGQMGVGDGIGIDLVESESYPKEIDFQQAVPEAEQQESVIVTNFSTGMSTMLACDSKGRVYKTGLKIDFLPKMINFNPDLLPLDCEKYLACSERQFIVLDKTNEKVHASKGVFANKSATEHEGFFVYDTKEIFNEGKVQSLSMKYDCFGAIVHH